MLTLIKQSPHRNQLEQYLKEHLPKLSGRILEIGSKNRRYDYLLKSKPVAIDLAEEKSKEVERGDVNDLKFRDASFESIICLEVLEYVSTPEKAVRELHRVLTPGGTLILSVPFMYALHGDQLRYTENYLKILLKDFTSVKIDTIGNAYSIILDILYGKIKHITFSLLRYLCTLLYLPFAMFLSKKSHSARYSSGYIVIAQK